MIYVFGTNQPNYTAYQLTLNQTDFSIIPENAYPEAILTQDLLLRYGLSHFPYLDYHFNRIINRAKSIRNNINKAISCQKLYSSGITTPKIWLNKTEVELPCLGRRLHHSQGKHIKYIETEQDLNNDYKSYYFAQFIPSISEYRIHVLKTEIVRMSKKIKIDESAHPFIRSRSKGWKLIDNFIWKLGENLLTLTKQTAIDAVAALNLEFGAVDCLISKNQIPYILEVNTAPRLDNRGQEIFREAIRKYANSI